jgi:hypothetical protein
VRSSAPRSYIEAMAGQLSLVFEFPLREPQVILKYRSYGRRAANASSPPPFLMRRASAAGALR